MIRRLNRKRRLVYCFFTGILSFSATLFQPDIAHPIGFLSAVSLALRTSPESAIQSARVASARGRLAETRGQLLPHLGLGWTAGRSDNPLTVLGYRLSEGRATFGDFGLAGYTAPSALDTPPAALDDPGYADDFDTGIVLNVPLFASGVHTARSRGARALLSAREAYAGATPALVTFEVLGRYDGVHAARGLFRAAQQAIQAAQSDLRTAQSLFRRGLVIRSDVEAARAHLAEVRAQEAAARARWQDALDSFRIALGLPTSSRVVPGPAVRVLAPRAPLAQLEHLLFLDNPRLRALHARIRAQDAFLDATQDARGPRLNLILRHDWNGQTPSFHAPSNTFLLELRWNLYTAGVESGAESRARARRRIAQAELVRSKRRLERILIRREREIHVTEREVRASRAATHEAHLAAHLVALRYRHGLGTLTQLLAAQARLDRARAELVLSRFRSVLVRAALRLTLNRLDPAMAVPFPRHPSHTEE
jgi:outer membrane protein TolC